MSFLARFGFSIGAGAAAALALGGAAPDAPPWPRFPFPPDLQLLAHSTFFEHWPQTFDGVAGSIAGSALFLALTAAGRPPRLAVLALAALNPLALYAFSLGGGATLAFAAQLLFFGAIAALGLERDHSATVGLGVAAAAAPLVSNAVIALFPLALLLTPALSSWGTAPRRLTGVLTVISAPFLMTSGAILYLYWLLGAPARPPAMIIAAPPEDIFLVGAGAALVGGLGRTSSAFWLAAAFVAGGFLLLMVRPELSVLAALAPLADGAEAIAPAGSHP